MDDICSDNPWSVPIENFLHFCCPECDSKDKNRESFIQHALENHPMAVEYLIKDELSTENYTIGCDPLNSNKFNIDHEVPIKKEIDVKSKNEVFVDVESKLEDDDNMLDDGYEEQLDFKEVSNDIKDGANEDEIVLDIFGENNEDIDKLKTHKCELCEKSFKLFAAWKTHMNSQHPEVELLNCVTCRKEFSSIEMKIHHKCQNTIQCKICYLTFESRQSLRAHQRRGHNNGSFKCEFCSIRKSTQKGLDKHMSNLHSAQVCDSCGKSFANKEYLHQHKKIHTGERKVKCKQCEKVFSGTEALGKHVKAIHDKIKDHICNYCGKSFSQRVALAGHIKRIHEGEMHVSCKICSEKFSSLKFLYKHYDQAHSGYHNTKCPECDKEFEKRSVLKKHIQAVHKKVEKLSCENCGKTFAFKEYLTQHQKGRHGRGGCLPKSQLIKVKCQVEK